MYRSPYNTERPYTGHSRVTPACPICGARGFDCPVTVTALTPYPPVDLPNAEPDGGGRLRRYVVTLAGASTVMQLNDTDAARYGDAAVPSP